MEQKLLDWRDSLPSYFESEDIPLWFRGPRAILLWKAQNLRIMLWRGAQRFPQVKPGRGEASLRCQQAALETIGDITSFCRKHADIIHIGMNWYITYFLFQAALVLDLHQLEQQPSAPDDELGSAWLTGRLEARNSLQDLGRTNKAATRCLAVLDRIHNHFISARQSSVRTDATGPESSEASSAIQTQPSMPGNDMYNRTQEETTPDAAAMYGSHWSLSADPSLSMFLDNTPMDNLFEDVQGFPSTLEQEYFDYVTGNMYHARTNDPDQIDWSTFDSMG